MRLEEEWRQSLEPSSHSSSSRSCARRRRGARALGLSLAVASGFPAGCNAALSISSGYENFLMQIRRRIVCEEGDVFDEAEQRVARPCDSMKDGPFCRGLPLSSAVPRHRPFTVDSIVPQHLFGDGEKVTGTGEEGEVTTNKQATATLNQFLEEFYNLREGPARVMAVEGRMDFTTATPPWRDRGMPAAFSRGMPEGIVATWEGAWQALPALEGVAPSGRPSSIIRMNGVVGIVRFSRPVVVRHLVVRPPFHTVSGDGEASTGGHRLLVRGRKAGVEAWRSAYDFGGDSSSSSTSTCNIGDLVAARWTGDGKRYIAVVIEAHNETATLRWLDDDHTHRLVQWWRIKTVDGAPCRRTEEGLNRTDAQGAQGGTSGKASRSFADPWRDLARKVKTVDEIAFSVPFGAEGWLLGEISVAAVRAPVQEADPADPEAAAQAYDPSSFMVQVFPGPWAQIVKVSSAAVIYNADDMLERGLRLHKSAPSQRQSAAATGTSSKDFGEDDDASGEASGDGRVESAQLRLSTSRSVEGLRQLLRALADLGDSAGHKAVRLPAHITQEQFLADAEKLTVALEGSRAEVKKYGHFEAFFAVHWDWATPADALQVVFERWRRALDTQREARNAFFKGQVWTGSYFCTQGPTQLTLSVTKVSQDANGQADIEADLSFQLREKAGKTAEDAQDAVSGEYVVAGKMEEQGRALSLDPVPGSWKTKPKNFVMVGLQGMVSRSGQPGVLRYAGSIPIFGCDSFELTAKSNVEVPVTSSTPPPAASKEAALAPSAAAEKTQRALWNSALARLAESLAGAQKRWRLQLQALIAEKGKGKDGTTSAGAAQVQQLFEAARTAGLVSFELTTADGEQFSVKIGK